MITDVTPSHSIFWWQLSIRRFSLIGTNPGPSCYFVPPAARSSARKANKWLTQLCHCPIYSSPSFHPVAAGIIWIIILRWKNNNPFEGAQADRPSSFNNKSTSWPVIPFWQQHPFNSATNWARTRRVSGKEAAFHLPNALLLRRFKSSSSHIAHSESQLSRSQRPVLCKSVASRVLETVSKYSFI